MSIMLDPLSHLPSDVVQQFLLNTDDTCPCGKNCCRDENDRLREENARLRAAIVAVDQVLTPVSGMIMSARMRLAIALGTAGDA